LGTKEEDQYILQFFIIDGKSINHLVDLHTGISVIIIAIERERLCSFGLEK